MFCKFFTPKKLANVPNLPSRFVPWFTREINTLNKDIVRNLKQEQWVPNNKLYLQNIDDTHLEQKTGMKIEENSSNKKEYKQ